LLPLDDDAFLETSATADIGEIQLKIWRVVSLGKGKHVAPPVEQKVHERAKKATSHRVMYVSITLMPNYTLKKSIYTWQTR